MEEILLKGIKTEIVEKSEHKEKDKPKTSYKIEGEKLKKLKTFESLNSELYKKLQENNFLAPFLVQKLVIPYFFNNKSAIVCSFTGSGKTLSYLIPIVEMVSKYEEMKIKKPKAVIVVPTKELMVQVFDILKLISLKQIRIKKLKVKDSEFDILVTMPHSLLSLTDCVKDITHLVVDEADLIFSDRYSKFINFILNSLKDYHLSVFSATINGMVEEICKRISKINRIYVKGLKDINHEFIFGTTNAVKHVALLQKIEEGVETPCLIFVKNEETAKSLKNFVENSEIICKTQKSKNSIIENFRLKRIWFLITTDVLSRGMDFYNIKSVINYDFPNNKTQFVHRVGRVNRHSSGQHVYTFFTKEDFIKLRGVASFLKENGSDIPQSILNIIKSLRN